MTAQEKTKPAARHVRSEDNNPLCGAYADEHPIGPPCLVEGALHSNCTDCRGKLMIGPVGQTGCDMRPIPEPREPSPLPGAETMLADSQRLRDGR